MSCSMRRGAGWTIFCRELQERPGAVFMKKFYKTTVVACVILLVVTGVLLIFQGLNLGPAVARALANHPEKWELRYADAQSAPQWPPGVSTKDFLVRYLSSSKSVTEAYLESIACGLCVALVFSALGWRRELKFEKSRMSDKTD